MKIGSKFVPRGLTYEKCEFSKIIEKTWKVLQKLMFWTVVFCKKAVKIYKFVKKAA